jgi:hypothetical protein
MFDSNSKIVTSVNFKAALSKRQSDIKDLKAVDLTPKFSAMRAEVSRKTFRVLSFGFGVANLIV